MVPTAKAGQMDPVFTWEETLPLSVYEGGRDPKEGVRWEGGYCPLCKGCVNVGFECDVVWQSGERVEQVLVEMSRGRVWGKVLGRRVGADLRW